MSRLLARAAGITLASGMIAAGLAAPALATTTTTVTTVSTTFAPAALPAPTVSSPDYPPNASAGGIGRPGRFTFSANGSTDVVGFRYGPDFPSTYVAADQPGGSATVWITPTTFGVQKVAVKSVDAAGNSSPITTYWFDVNGG
ncbi:hypothetical protein [Kutzneria sp. CA-103260]|uniref:hypothetical protein n=1 Tax=Kutzneria sp. CA-103260 TaxID=2802641 RepID=UPI001BA4A8C6|nr:hypothetical protein [Kutzneria sp. CA-103260]